MKLVSKLLILAALSGAAFAADKPDFSGDWKINFNRSNFGQIPAPANYTRKITHAEPSLTIEETQTGTAGRSIRGWSWAVMAVLLAPPGGHVRRSTRSTPPPTRLTPDRLQCRTRPPLRRGRLLVALTCTEYVRLESFRSAWSVRGPSEDERPAQVWRRPAPADLQFLPMHVLCAFWGAASLRRESARPRV